MSIRSGQCGTWLRGCVVLTITLALACNSDTTGPTPVVLAVSPDSVFLYRGDSAQLSIAVLDKDSALITGVSVSFQSSNTAIATVSVTGLVRSPGPAGTAHITVTVTGGGLQRAVPVVVQGKPASLTLAPADTTIRQGQSYQLRAAVIDTFGDPVPGQAITYQSLNSNIVVVSGGGLVTTGPVPGQTKIRASSGAFVDTASVTVQDTNIIARVSLGDAPYGVAASVNGVVYVTPIIGPAVRRLNMTTFTLTDAITVGGDPAQVTFNGVGDTAYVTKRASGSVAIVSVSAHAQVDTVIVPPSPYPILVSANGSTAYVARSTNGQLYKLDLVSRARVDSTAVPGYPLHLTFGPGDSLLYVSSHDAGTVTEIRAATLATVRTFAVGGVPQAVRVSQDGAELYIADEAGPLHIWSLTSGTEIDTVHTGGGTFGVALTPDGTKLYVTTTLGKVLLVNRATRAVLHTVIVGGTPRLVAVDPITGYAVVPNESGGWIDVVR